MTTRPLTSASNLHRRKLCPGSARMEKGLPDKESEEASEGTMLHAAIVGTSTGLTEEQAWAVQFCKDTESRIISETFGVVGPKVFREFTLDLWGNEFGHADFIALRKDTAIVLDWKFGRNEVEAAEANMQLRAYAVMVAQTFGVSNVVAGIVQPRVEAEKRVTLTVYGAHDIQKAEDEIASILSLLTDDAPLVPALAQCQYCRAKATCPALHAQSTALEAVSPAVLTEKEAAEAYRRCKLVEKHLDAIKSKVFLMVQNAEAEGRSIPGITLKPGTARRVVTDAQKAFSALSATLTPAEFAGACTVKVSALDTVFKEKSGLKAKQAKEALEGLLTEAGCLEMKQSEASLVLTEK